MLDLIITNQSASELKILPNLTKSDHVPSIAEIYIKDITRGAKKVIRQLKRNVKKDELIEFLAKSDFPRTRFDKIPGANKFIEKRR